MNNQQKQAFDALRKKMNEAGVIESELNEFIEGNNSKRNTTKEQASEAYIKGKLRDIRECLGCEDSRRMTLIQRDMHTVQKAFEDGWDESEKEVVKKTGDWIIGNVHKYISVIGNSSVNFDYIGFICDYKKAMEE